MLGDHLIFQPKTYNTPIFGNLLKTKGGLNDLYDINTQKVYTALVPYADSTLTTATLDLTTATGSPHPILAGFHEGRAYSTDLKNGLVLTSVYKNQKNKVTIYSNTLMFLECRALVMPDHETRNGLIHYVNGPILPHVTASYDRSTVLAAIKSLPDGSAFFADIPQDVKDKLSKTDAKWMTAFVPSNAAWNAVKAKYSDADYITSIVKNHFLNKMICSGAVTRRVRKLGKTFADENIGFDCPKINEKKVLDICGNGFKINQADLMAGNGVVHAIEGVLLPLSVRDDTLACLGTGFDLSRTVKEMKGCDLQIKVGGKYIWLLPTNAAYTWFENYKPFQAELKRFQTDATYRCNVFKYHVLQLGAGMTDLPASWWNQIGFKTNYNPGRDSFATNYYVKYRYGSELFFHYARVTNKNALKYANGYVYMVDRINVIPEKTCMDYLKSRSDLSKTYGFTKQTKLDSVIESAPPRFLYLVPRDQGWGNRPEAKWDTGRLKNLLKMHMVRLYLWGDDIGYFQRETYSTVNSIITTGSNDVPFELRFKRNLNGQMFIGYDNLPMDQWAMVLEFNRYAYDCNVWVIDWPLKCPVDICQEKKFIPEVDTYTVYAMACNDRIVSDAKFKANAYDVASGNKDKCTLYKVPTIEVYKNVPIN